MRISSKEAPPGAYRIDRDPVNPEEVRIRMFENARKVTVETHWEYEEYQLTVPYTDGLQADIENNYSDWIRDAKTREAAGLLDADDSSS